MATGSVALGAGGTVIGVNVLVPIVGYVADFYQLPPMSEAVQVSVATIGAGLVTVGCYVAQALWRKWMGPIETDLGNQAGS